MLLNRNGYVREPVTAQFLFDVSKALHDDVDSLLTNNDQRPEQLISHFVALVSMLCKAIQIWIMLCSFSS